MNANRKQVNQEQGFTLVELVIVVAIIAILAAIALPNYLRYVEKAQCEDGKALVTSAVNYMERQRANNGGRYTGVTLNNFGTSSTVFGLALSNATVTDYTLTATTKTGARISGNLTVTAANVRGGSLQGKCSW